MRLYWIIVIFILCPFITLAQNTSITGKVVNANGKNPVAKASVFLSNATYGTATAEDGSFTLAGVKPGQYELVVTTVGYEDYSQIIQVGRDPVKLNIELTQKVLMLREVVISSAADWKKNYELFRRDFIGTTENSKLCRVVNPHILNLIYHRNKQQLEASGDEFLVVENRALGYRTKFLLKSFLSDAIEHTIQYSGKALFEELPGSAEQKKVWKQKREEAYYGSPQHFYRSLYKDKLKEEGFEAHDFTRLPNRERPDEALILQKIKRYRDITPNRDSLINWYKISNLTKWNRENLVRIPYQSFEILRKTPQQGIFALTCPHFLYVVYTKKEEMTEFKDVYRPLDMGNFETSIVTLFQGYILFDMNGIVVSNPSPQYEGTWSKAKLADLLPVDYEPGD
ncbi:carboxypeptidase-like regulatory domain-containing protein [Mucilaginibacter sabulilitoris]|uniref:Carboxypeptidase-like regulatory domain-containing protein n=1 Tax=Mucilaginibacter sabulilitoris TaxID=1173583 RepID=A0ABZ0TTX6_9SPHI|nr:carboxypeptidase-like regulatory domain-containing protein [Mucilaginibacter sabulilitoris]WPU96568.1 carboxypeptidase-like regulatory domain-containing protein [Mucilaginibacter sabulilitoris]